MKLLLLLGLVLLAVGLQFPFFPIQNTTQTWTVSQVAASGSSPYSAAIVGIFQAPNAIAAINEASNQSGIPASQLQAAPNAQTAYAPRTQLGG